MSARPAIPPSKRLRGRPLAVLLLVGGCGGAFSPADPLAGVWVGRPETSAERVLREWPTDESNAASAEAAAAEPPTDLERLADLRIEMRLGPLGEAELTLGGGRTRRGEWRAEVSEGRRLQLEMAVSPEGSDGAARELRRFDVEMLPPEEGQPDRFLLREMNAEPRFGRLLFERAED